MAAAMLPNWRAAQAEPTPPASKPGDTFEVTRVVESSTQASDGSSSSSSDQYALVERVMAVRDGGMEVEYDFAKETPAGDRASEWRFPARVFESFNGSVQLLDAAEMEGRLDGWLKSGGLTRASCGHWIFTWNAFRIECDPQSVIASLEAFDLDSIDLRDGALYRDPRALAPAPLMRTRAELDRPTFVANLVIDPDVVRRARAQSDVVAAEIAKHSTETVDDALRARAGETIAGTISVTFETDAWGRAWRRTEVEKVEIKAPDGRSESQTVTETVERRPISPSGD